MCECACRHSSCCCTGAADRGAWDQTVLTVVPETMAPPNPSRMIARITHRVILLRCYGADASCGFNKTLLTASVLPHAHCPLVCRPSLGESLKWGWVQFMAAFAALWWLASCFESAVFGLRLLPTRVVSDAQPPARGLR